MLINNICHFKKLFSFFSINIFVLAWKRRIKRRNQNRWRNTTNLYFTYALTDKTKQKLYALCGETIREKHICSCGKHLSKIPDGRKQDRLLRAFLGNPRKHVCISHSKNARLKPNRGTCMFSVLLNYPRAVLSFMQSQCVLVWWTNTSRVMIFISFLYKWIYQNWLIVCCC